MNRNWDEVDRKSTHLGEIIAAKNIRGGGGGSSSANASGACAFYM